MTREERHRHDQQQPLLGALEVLELTGPREPHSGRELHLIGDHALRLVDVVGDGAIGVDEDEPDELAVLAAHHGRAGPNSMSATCESGSALPSAWR